jgi:small-conductance mechanosensitive channel
MNRITYPFSLFLAIICVFILTISVAVYAQETDSEGITTSTPKSLGPTAMESLVAKMSPEQTQALAGLMELLDESLSNDDPAFPDSQQTALELIQQWIRGFADALITNTLGIPSAFNNAASSLSSLFTGKTSSQVMLFFAYVALAIAIGALAEKIFDKIVAPKRISIRQLSTDSLLGTLKTLSSRIFLDIGDVIVFGIVALVATKFLFSDATAKFVVSAFIINAILIARFISAILRFTLAPKRADLRLVFTDDWTAQFIYSGFVKLTIVVGLFLFFIAVTEDAGFLDTQTLRFWFSLFGHVWIIYVTWKARKGLTSIILGDDEVHTEGLERMAAWWPPICIGILAFNWFLIQFIVSTGNETLTSGRGAMAVLMIVMLPFFDTIVRGIAGHLVPEMEGSGATAEKAQNETRYCYIRIGRVILIVMVVLLIGKLWGINFRNLAEAGMGDQIASNGVAFLLILAVGYMGWEITNLTINRRLAREMEAMGIVEDGESGEGGGTGLTRMATILPIMRMTLQVTIIIITILLALSQLGVNITPLLAGAGVLGLAIGFGAQTLVKDIVSGVFFLLDDAFRAGEFVDVGGTEGTVEKISIRSLQLRGVRGPIHVVPYGSISKLTNMSRDWVIMKLKFTIPFDTDIEKVRKLFKKIGQEMLEVPELAEKFLAPFKGQGAADVTDVGIVVRGKFTTRPGDQWEIRKQVYNRVQKAFAENGIEFARKEVRVTMPHDVDVKHLSEDQKNAIKAVASEAAETSPEDKK